MKIIANLGKGVLTVGSDVFSISNNVRTIRNGTRRADEVIHTVPNKQPYDPHTFPKGTWNVTAVEWQDKFKFDQKTYGPVKIRTDAWQMVNVWELDADGYYFKETTQETKDEGYLLHYSTSLTTLGCIRLASPADAETIASIIQKCFFQREEVKLEVI